MSYKSKIIIFSDLDGTLLGDNHYFSKLTKETVKKLYDNGIHLIPVTARNTNDVITQARRLGLHKLGGIAAGNNGSQIYDFKKKKWVLNKYLPKEVVLGIHDQFYNEIKSKQKAKVSFFANESTYVFGESENSLYWAQLQALDYIVAKNKEDIDQEISHLTIILKKDTPSNTSKKIIGELKQKYSHLVDVNVYTERVIDLSPKNINKGFAVKTVMKYLKINEEKVTSYAFGDSYNDLPMFDAVKIGVALENANITLKDVSDDQTELNNDNSGVANYIIKNILNN